jgi:magnesium-transporting ATPase (P-type)
LVTDAAGGLTAAEAAARQAHFGPNVMTPPRRTGLLRALWAQVANVLIGIVLAAAVVAGVLGDWVELGFILGVVVLNVGLGMLLDVRAEAAAGALRKLLSPMAGEWLAGATSGVAGWAGGWVRGQGR